MFSSPDPLAWAAANVVFSRTVVVGACLGNRSLDMIKAHSPAPACSSLQAPTRLPDKECCR